MLIYCPDRYKTQKMCKEAVDDCLGALKFISNWFIINKMIERFHDALRANDDILFFNKDFHKVTFFANQVDILAVDLDKINLDDDNSFDEDDPILLFMSDFWLGIVHLKNSNHLEKDKQRINVFGVASSTMMRLVHVRR